MLGALGTASDATVDALATTSLYAGAVATSLDAGPCLNDHIGAACVGLALNSVSLGGATVTATTGTLA